MNTIWGQSDTQLTPNTNTRSDFENECFGDGWVRGWGGGKDREGGDRDIALCSPTHTPDMNIRTSCFYLVSVEFRSGSN